MIDLLQEKYEFEKLLNNYIITKPLLPTDSTKIKTELTYVYPIANKQLARTFIQEIKYKYKFRILLPSDIMTVNP